MKSNIDAPKFSSITINFEGEYRNQIESINERISELNKELEASRKEIKEKNDFIRSRMISLRAYRLIVTEYSNAIGHSDGKVLDDYLVARDVAKILIDRQYKRNQFF